MNKLLLVGDVHCVPEELDDCQALINYICKIAVEQKAGVCFMGDQYNTMSIVRVEVMNFWINAFNKMNNLKIKVRALVGNHDYAGAGLFIHSMSAHSSSIHVIEEPGEIVPGVLALSYFDKNDEFIDCIKNWSGVNTLLCHQTFQGSTYDNGFYAPDGIDPDLFSQEKIISGHIHSPQSFGKVTYIGAPRWRTLSDANINRAIWLYDFDNEGNIVSKIPFSTNDVCRQIKYLLDSPLEPIAQELSSNVDWRIDIKGPVNWIEKRKVELAGPGIKIRTFKTTGTKPVVKESDGIGLAFKKYLEKFVPKHGTNKEYLTGLAKERLGV
jgi:DNA repair exonuclease SbcCD nuclease subunit